MSGKRTKKDFVPHISEDSAPKCHAEGCGAQGVYKAPKSKAHLNEYQWFCLDHIREYNNKWDYFAGMDRDEIEEFMKEAVTGHRPTWTREGNVRQRYERLQDAFHAFFNQNRSKGERAYPTAMPKKMQEAMVLMELDFPYTASGLKRQYRRLVKQYHPDVNRDDHAAEEKFKEISAAYVYLSAVLEEG